MHELNKVSQADNNNFTTFLNISVTNHIGFWTSQVDNFLCKLVENVKDPLKWWLLTITFIQTYITWLWTISVSPVRYLFIAIPVMQLTYPR